MGDRTGTKKSDNTCRRGGGGSECAFTLLEVLIVVAVLSVVSVAVVISAASVDGEARVRHAADDLSLLFESTAQQASLTYQPWMIEIAPGSGVVGVSSIAGEADAEGLRHHLPGSVRIEAIRIGGEEASRPVQVLAQPSGYIQPIDLTLAYETLEVPVTWDAQQRLFASGE